MSNLDRYIVFLLILVVCAASHNAPRCLAAGVEHSDALVVYHDATNVRFSKRGSSDQVTYYVRAEFPAATVIDRISQKLHEAGWKPLANDFLDPGSSSAQMRSWQEGLAGPKKPWVCVHRWIGDWKDSSGNIVRYAFSYKQPCASHASSDLKVVAVYIPAAGVRQLEKSVEKYRETLKTKE